MGIVGDFLRFMGSVILGKKDSARAFQEGLAMAERYVRWGAERGDLRDYGAALQQLDLCRDDDVPKPELLVRKYTTMCNGTVGMAELLIRKHKQVRSGADKSQSELVKEQQALTGQIDVSEKRVEHLKSEGSLIKARDEDRHIDELKAKLAHVAHTLESGESMNEVTSSFDDLVSETERYCQNLEAAVVALEVNPVLPPDAVNTLSDQIQGRLEYIRREVQACNPNAQAQAAPAEGGTE